MVGLAAADARSSVTTYSNNSFEDTSEDNPRCSYDTNELYSQSSDLWEYGGVTTKVPDIQDMVRGTPRNTTCGRDKLLTEVWAAAMAADSRHAARVAWATNQRIANHRARAWPGERVEMRSTRQSTMQDTLIALYTHTHTTFTPDKTPHNTNHTHTHKQQTDEHTRAPAPPRRHNMRYAAPRPRQTNGETQGATGMATRRTHTTTTRQGKHNGGKDEAHEQRGQRRENKSA